MARLIEAPTCIKAQGSPPKVIEEFFGLVNTGDREVSIARMVSPAGWAETGQTPEFDEYTIVLHGALQVETRSDSFHVSAGQAILVSKGEWVRYSSPGAEGADYLAVCLPAFSLATVHRDE